MNFLVIETDDGLMVVEQNDQETAEQSAVRHGGVLADPTLYKSYEDAIDALQQIKTIAEEDLGKE